MVTGYNETSRIIRSNIAAFLFIWSEFWFWEFAISRLGSQVYVLGGIFVLFLTKVSEVEGLLGGVRGAHPPHVQKFHLLIVHAYVKKLCFSFSNSAAASTESVDYVK